MAAKDSKAEDFTGKMIGNYAYRLQETIDDNGSQGAVFLAEDLRDQNKRKVAIKVLRPEDFHEETRKARFVQEVEVLEKLWEEDSHHIVPVLDWELEERIEIGNGSVSIAYFVMNYYERGSLQDKIDKNRDTQGNKIPLDFKDAISITHQVLLALEQTHNKNVIHRDIKPGNILFQTEEFIRLGDFGLAKEGNKSLGSDINKPPVGTFPYKAPEVMAGKNADPVSDLYSVGIMLYQMLTTRLPSGILTITDSIRTDNPSIPETFNLDILRKLVERDRGRRYQSANEVRKVLGNHLGQTGVLPPLPSVFLSFLRTRRLVFRQSS